VTIVVRPSPPDNGADADRASHRAMRFVPQSMFDDAGLHEVARRKRRRPVVRRAVR
jgi:hypothetical protein